MHILHKIIETKETGLIKMGRLLGLMLFCIGLGMVIGILIVEHIVIVIAAAVCLLCGYHLFCR